MVCLGSLDAACPDGTRPSDMNGEYPHEWDKAREEQTGRDTMLNATPMLFSSWCAERFLFSCVCVKGNSGHVVRGRSMGNEMIPLLLRFRVVSVFVFFFSFFFFFAATRTMKSLLLGPPVINAFLFGGLQFIASSAARIWAEMSWR